MCEGCQPHSHTMGRSQAGQCELWLLFSSSVYFPYVFPYSSSYTEQTGSTQTGVKEQCPEPVKDVSIQGCILSTPVLFNP